MNIVVTGASNGIGYHTALKLSLDKHKVFALARSLHRLERLRDDAARRGGEIVAVEMDLADGTSIEAGCRAVAAQAEHIDVLVHNAGLLVNKPFALLEETEWRAVYEVNVFGPATVTRKLLPLMKGGAHIVHISSMGGVQGAQKFPGLSAYSSAKAALVTLTECLAEEFRDYGIAVNCLALGSVSTEMFAAAFPGAKAALEAEEAAGFISWFALNGRPYFNGKVLPVSVSTP